MHLFLMLDTALDVDATMPVRSRHVFALSSLVVVVLGVSLHLAHRSQVLNWILVCSLVLTVVVAGVTLRTAIRRRDRQSVAVAFCCSLNAMAMVWEALAVRLFGDGSGTVSLAIVPSFGACLVLCFLLVDRHARQTHAYRDLLVNLDARIRETEAELRISHEQNMILADVKQSELYALWQAARDIGFATPNIGLLTDMIVCPGGDFCALANAKSIPVAEAIQHRFDDLDYLYDIGDVDMNFSGCMNSCGHHHIGNIGILGVDKNGSEWYQVSLGGEQGNKATLGKVIGPSFAQEEMPDVIEKIINVYIEQRHADERFIDTVRRIGIDPFKERVYAKAH